MKSDAYSYRPFKGLAPALLSGLIGLGCILSLTDTSLALSVQAQVDTGAIDQFSDPFMRFFIGDSQGKIDQVGPVTATSTTNVGDVFAAGTATSEYGAEHGIVSVSYAGPPNEGSGRAAATSHMTGTWSDEFSVVSSNLAHGTPVALTGRLTLDGVAFADGGFVNGMVEASLINYNTGDRFALTYTYGAGSLAGGFLLSTPITINTSVGDRISIAGALQMQANVDTIYMPASGTQRIAPSALIFDVSHTALFTLTSATPGAGFIAASGTSYAPVSSVPEPSTWLLLGTGLVGLTWWRRKQAA